jgi:hypothetical protein
MRPDQFQDISIPSGFTGSYYSWGSAWGDPDQDGDPDLFVTNHYRTKDHNYPFLYRNLGGFFVRDTLAVLDSVTDMHGHGWMDVDNDGDDDFYGVTGRASRNLYLENNAGVLEDRTYAMGLQLVRSRGRTPIWWDANGDGRLDLFVSNGTPLEPSHRRNTLLYWTGSGFETSATDSMGHFGTLESTGGLIADPFGEGQTALGIYTETEFAWWMPGCDGLEPRMRYAAQALLAAQSADLNNDGRSDLYLMRNKRGQSMALYPFPVHYEESYDMAQVRPDSCRVHLGPMFGSASIDATGRFNYTAPSGFSGIDSFVVQACDSFGGCQFRLGQVYAGLPLPDGVKDAWAIPSGGSLSLSIPQWYQPWQRQIRTVLFPQDLPVAGFRFSNASDSLSFGLPLGQVPDSLVFLGASERHPEGELIMHLSASDTSLWGAPSLSLGVEDGMILYYDTALALWTVSLSAVDPDVVRRVEFTLQSPQEMDPQDPVGFSLTPLAVEDRLLLSTDNGYEDVTATAGLDFPMPGTAVVFADFDNDGDEDLFVSCSLGDRNLPNRLYVNNGHGVFDSVPESAGLSGERGGASGTPTIADVTGDGFLDVFIGNGRAGGSGVKGPYRLYRNRGNNNHWLRIRLQGTASNREGVGTVLHCWTEGKRQMRVATGGQHRQAQNERVVHFGLGLATAVDSLVLHWPSGRVQRLYSITADQILDIVEPDGPNWTCQKPYGLFASRGETQNTFQWYGLPCSDSYAWRLLDATGLELENLSVLDTVWQYPNPLPGTGPWYWQVRAQCPDGSLGPWSLRRMLPLDTVSALSDPFQPEARSLWRLVPNPAADWLLVQPQSGQASASLLELRLLDPNGRCVLSAAQAGRAAACHPHQRLSSAGTGEGYRVSLPPLPSGVYTVELLDETARHRLPLVVAQ